MATKFFNSPKPVAAIGIVAAAISLATFLTMRRRALTPDDLQDKGA